MGKKQPEFNLNKGQHGGRRPGAGRKRVHSKGVAHRTRESVSHRTPLHINFKYRLTVRNKECLRILKRAIVNARKMGLRIIHFSLQHHHVHLIIEAGKNETLTRGMRSLTITMAKRIKRGRIQLERYHLHVLKTIRETRNAIHYVLFNEQRHGGKVAGEYSSLLSIPEALTMIKKFANKKKITLVVSIKDDFELDRGRCYLLQQSV